MSVSECLRSSVDLFEALPLNVRMHPVDEVITGPGGSWKAAFWLDRSNGVRAAIIPLDGGEPVALTSVWVDPLKAVRAARVYAKIAAEVGPMAAPGKSGERQHHDVNLDTRRGRA